MAEAEPAGLTQQERFDPTTPGYLDDPYAHYARLREHEPVHRDAFDVWYLFAYDDAWRVLRDASLSVDEASHALTPGRQIILDELRREIPNIDSYGNESLLNRDPPDHTRLRGLVTRSFTRQRVESLRPTIKEFVDDALDRMEAEGGTDLIRDLAFPLPLRIVSDLLGLPEDSQNEHLRSLTRRLIQTMDPLGTLEECKVGAQAKEELVEYLAEAIVWKRRHPGVDLLTDLVGACDGGAITDVELRDQALLMFVAGHETTVNLIGNGTLALLRHRDQYSALSADPSLIDTGVDELLRFDSPVQFAKRFTVDPLTVRDTVIPSGSMVLVALGSANRDPARWGEDADQVNLRRAEASQHLAFGSGIHRCLGAALARIEGQVVFASLARRFPHMTLATDEDAWARRMFLRGLQSLPLSLEG